jgi:hypothetical protein
MSKAHELATVASAPLATQDAELAALLSEYGNEGLENVTSDDVKVPRLAILQPTSPLSSEDGFSAGNIANLQTLTNYGSSVELIPLFYWSTAVHGMSGDMTSKLTPCFKLQACPDAAWIDDKPPKCTLFKNVLVLPLAKAKEGETLIERVTAATPAVFAAKRTSIKGTNEFLTLASLLRIGGKPTPLFASLYKLNSEKVIGEKGTFFTPKFSRVDLIKDVELFKFLRQMYIDMKLISEKISSDVIRQESSDYSTERNVTSHVDINEDEIAF